MARKQTYEQKQLFDNVMHKQQCTSNGREPVQVKFKFYDGSTNWLNLTAEQVSQIYTILGQCE